MIRRTFSKPGRDFTSEAYSADGKTWRWAENDALVPQDAAREYGIPVDVEAQGRAITDYYTKIAAEYRKLRGDGPTAEERAEARAAHGPGVTLVDVFTGRTWTT